MNTLATRIGLALVLVLGLLASAAASASVVMTFDELNIDSEYVDNFYNGGCGSPHGLSGDATCGGPDYGVVFSQALAGGGPWGRPVRNAPSAPNVMMFDDNASAYLDVAAGFSGGFSFYYSACRGSTSFSVTTGVYGRGTVLASMDLSPNQPDCGDYPEYFAWTPIGASFSGLARSVTFDGGSAYFGFAYDNMTLGSATPVNPVPEPAALAMFGVGVLLIGVFAGSRRRIRQS